MVLVVVPLSFLKRLDSLKYASMVALSSVFYLVVLVVVHFCKDDIEDRGPVRLFTPRSAAVVFATFPIFVFAYTCHQNMFSLVNELEDKSGRNINRVISYAISVAVSLYILVGVTGYVSFGDTVPPNVIVGYKSSVSSTVGRVAIVVLVMLSYPLQCHPARASINHIIHYFTHVSKLSNTLSSKLSTVFDTLSTLSQRSDTASSSLVQPQQVQPQPPQQVQQVPVQEPVPEPRTDRVLSNEFDVLIEYDELTEEAGQGVAPLIGARFYIITTLILVFSYLVAITVTSLAHVLAFVGSTGSTSISFILPGIFGYQLIGSEYYDEETREYSRDMPKVVQMVRYLALALTVWGFTVMVMCLSATIFLGASE
jgi:amino acid permease